MTGFDGLHLDQLVLRQDDFMLAADLRVPQGARVALIGPSGAGKSTLLAAIAGFLPPAQGHIRWNGDDMGALPPGERPCSILFQDNNLFPHLSIAENVALGLRPSLRLTGNEHAQVAGVLERVGLNGMQARKPAQLSGGQQSRAALARALLRSRPILLMDEPFAALGPALRAEMLALVAEICAASGATLLMVTHDMADARAICPQVVLVADGQATGPFETAGILANPPETLRAYIGG